MNKLKELFKKQRLTSWHIYGVVGLYFFIGFVFNGYTTGYEGYLERRTALTLKEFESLLAWITIMSLLMLTDLIVSSYFWYKESKED